MSISKNLKYFFILPALLSIGAVVAIAVWGLQPGIDLSGGALMRVSYPDGRPTVEQLHDATATLGFGEVRLQPSGEQDYVVRTRDLSESEHQSLLNVLGDLRAVQELEYTSVGPTIGAELLQKAWIAIALVVVLTVLFIAFAFRKVSEPVSSWKYGIIAIVTLLHDILVPVGLFALLGHFVGAEVDALFIVALLTILGISINDTIVIFDRIRENLALNKAHSKRESFEDTVDKSIRQTITRSINTSVTVIIVLVAMYFLGPEATRNFALTLIVGMVAGTYSSIFLASPLLVVWERLARKQ